MPNTYVALATQTLGTSASSVTFSLSGISGYTDLVLVSNLRYSSGSPSGNAYFRFNSDSGTNYSRTFLQGDGTSATSGRASNENGMYILGNTATASVFTTNITQIQNYSNTTTNKTVLSRWSNAGDYALAFVGLWRSTAAITSIDIYASGTTNFAVGSTFSLYGIANADQGAAKATGGIITEDSQYWYHTFGASGAFIPKQSLTCDVLVVAGGGGAGISYGAGGGGGGVIYFAGQSLTAISHNVTVGAGGVGNGTSNPGTNGVNSQFASLTAAVGGGGGGGQNPGAIRIGGSSGGSGGGGGANLGGGSSGGATTQTGTGATAFHGFAGGDGTTGAPGGGGGAGSAGTIGSSGGNGGGGTSAYSSWGLVTGTGVALSSTYYYAGGGSGYNASPNPPAAGGTARNVAGQTNSGQGAGGDAAVNGGSGVVIIRYSK